MSLIIATGSNLDRPLEYLERAKLKLSEHFNFEAESRIYSSKAVDFTDQPDFFNQVLQFKLPQRPPHQVLALLLEIEINLGRLRTIKRGPRTIDLDILFYGLDSFQEPDLEIPHPRLWYRSFVVRPLRELPYFSILNDHFDFADSFDVEAHPLS